ncbi:MAG: hypothetical protein M1416_01415 [Candidatus Pacearchaeota archaeon]|nr:hypothetical protein [Candidatus Pacearchaeota archaeon]
MSLEKSISKITKNIGNVIKVLSLTAFLTSCPLPHHEETKKYNYVTTITPVESREIDAEIGGIIEIINPESFIYGTKLTIPPGALQSDTTISVGEVNNPPVLPAGLNYVGTPVYLDSKGINFNNLTIQIPYNDSFLSDAGLSDDSNLKLYSYDESSHNWNEANIISLDIENNTITAEINHFSYYAITCFNAEIPEDLGNPQPGDLLYSLGAFWDPGNPRLKDNWMPGHVGIYVGEKPYTGGLATKEVKESGKYNIIEASGEEGFVIKNYSNPVSNFSGLNSYMGAREPKDFTLTQKQREDIVAFAEAQVGKDYAIFETKGAFFGLARGSLVKGPERFNCVGLAEAAYEYAEVNNGEGLVSFLQEEFGNEIEGLILGVLTPAEQYNATKPAKGELLGDGPAGGWIFYDKGYYSDGWRYLEAAPNNQRGIWGTTFFDVPGADGTEIGTGKQNTLDIITGDPALNKAADICADYSIINNGKSYDDWFLPSSSELHQMFLSLHKQGVGNFIDSFYWSSKESSQESAIIFYFNLHDYPSFYQNSKKAFHYIRPIRAF